ncbi:DUF1254 domain-containing protein [Rhodococcus sp. IEGM1300]
MFSIEKKDFAMKKNRMLLVLALSVTSGYAWSTPPTMKMNSHIPAEITTPDRVDTGIGTLEFFDGYPSDATIKLVYDNLDRQRAIEIFLDTIPAASLVAMRKGLREVGAVQGTVGIWEELLDSKSLLLTGNTESVYAFSWIDLSKGPVVVESPPNVLGVLDDFWFRYVADLGNAGPDKGKGGRFLILPPGYTGEVPEGYFVAKSTTFNNWLVWRGFPVDGDPKPAVANIKQHARIYPLSEAGSAHSAKFVDLSGREFNTIHANDASFFNELNEIIQDEPPESFDPEILGMAASIGLEKGKPFNPDERMQRLLREAAAIGNATARAIAFAPRDKQAPLYPGSQWKTPFLGGSYQWLNNGHRNLDARTGFFYAATVNTPAMVIAMPGVGSQYAATMRDSQGRWLDGGKNYRMTVPANPPAKDFWSVVVYDPQTRSLLQTDQRFPSLSSQSKILQKNDDGSIDLYFGPKPPSGKESNWVQTVPEKGWFPIYRLYGPLKPWFEKTWRLQDIERLD